VPGAGYVIGALGCVGGTVGFSVTPGTMVGMGLPHAASSKVMIKNDAMLFNFMNVSVLLILLTFL
jgi:hypothetical protein